MPACRSSLLVLAVALASASPALASEPPPKHLCPTGVSEWKARHEAETRREQIRALTHGASSEDAIALLGGLGLASLFAGGLAWRRRSAIPVARTVA